MNLDAFASELVISTPVARGSKDRGAVKRIQEWLCYHGHGVVVDGSFGPATEAAVRAWQGKLDAGKGAGIVGADVWDDLVEPMRTVVQPLDAVPDESLAMTVMRVAKQHAAHQPVEIGGENRGPWVRLYMRGNEGKEWPWCAGFTSFVLRQACDAHGLGAAAMPVPYRFGCDELAGIAKSKGILVQGESMQTVPARGWLFLVRKGTAGGGRYSHIGVVERVDVALSGVMSTIEGNTNDNGSAEGYAVCRRTRGWRDKDFIKI